MPSLMREATTWVIATPSTRAGSHHYCLCTDAYFVPLFLYKTRYMEQSTCVVVQVITILAMKEDCLTSAHKLLDLLFCAHDS